jgi:bifunctional non-homologous end joining protein LigD
MSLEGIVSKRADATYAPGNRGLWVKVKCLHREEFVVGGWTDPEGSRPWLGALLLGYYDPNGGHSVGCYLNNATAERTEKVAGHAATCVWPRLRGRRLSTVAAARSPRKSPEKLMCSQLSGDVWASHASGTDCSVARRWAMASAM